MVASFLLPVLLLSVLTTPMNADDPLQSALAPPVTQSADQRPAPIQDNSFLIEEAYNQEPGVIQHISTFQRNPSTRDWVYTFTEEWPVPGQAHQLSVTLPFERIGAAPDGASAFGDVLVNYRRQLVGDGHSRLAVAPRLSVILPAGNYRQFRGAGAVGYQLNIPASIELSPSFVTHANAGLTFTPRSRNERDDRADTLSWNLGQSLVWLAAPRFNAVLELVYTRSEMVVGPNRTSPANAWILNPGVRWAMNFKSGLQVVPGVSAPIGVGPSRGQRSLFVYLSLEHPLWRPF